MSDDDAEIANEFSGSGFLMGNDWATYLLELSEKPDELHLVVHSVSARLEQDVGENSVVWTCGAGGDLTSVEQVAGIVGRWK
jgi:hypothetical protein